MKSRIFAFLLVSLFTFCGKNADNFQEDLVGKSDIDQMKIMESMLASQMHLSSKGFTSLNQSIQKKIYSKLTAKNRYNLWENKLNESIDVESDTNEKGYLIEVRKFMHLVFEQKLDDQDILSNALSLEKKGFSLMDRDKFINIVSSPSLLSDRKIDVITNFVVPASGKFKCNVSSDYCPSGKSCIAPTRFCDTNSDSFCGFLLLMDCNGICTAGAR
jgi:hypothetical protein